MDGSDGTIPEIIGEIEKTLLLLIFFNYLIPITWAWHGQLGTFLT